MTSSRWAVLLLLLCSAGSVYGGAIYALDTSLGPLNGAEQASASVLLNLDTVDVLTVSFTYQLQSRFALIGQLFIGDPSSPPVLTSFGLPGLRSFGSRSSILLDDSRASDLVNQTLFLQLNTTAGPLSGNGTLVLSQRQGGGPPPPPFFFDTPEPVTGDLCGAALACLALLSWITGRQRQKNTDM